jgi:hypothetical protein
MVSKTKIILPVAIATIAALALVFQLSNALHNTKAKTEETREVEKDFDIVLSDEQIENAGLEFARATPGKIKLSITLPGKITVNPEAYAHIITHSPGIVKEAHKIVGDKFN